MLKYLLLFSSLVLAQTFNRSEWGSWVDADKDCQDTRQEVLIRQSFIPVTMDAKGCKVVSGLWFCLYTGTVTTDPSTLEIDHLVPLKEAFLSGGSSWDTNKKKAYANYLDNPYLLIAVNKNTNRSKQDKDVAHWLPPFEVIRCAYVRWWKEVKDQWGLTKDTTEATFIENYLRGCK